MERHRSEDLLELAAIVGGKKPERPPLAWLQRRTPEAKQVPLGSEFARALCLTGSDLFDGFR
jgi:hypothetical protein